MTKIVRISVLSLAIALAAVAFTTFAPKAQSAPSTPRTVLDTFFSSAEHLDYATTYGCYYQHYRDLVPQEEFVNRRKQGPVLTGYRIDSLSVNGTFADANVTLTFAPKPGSGATPRTTTAHEQLVVESGGWKIKVW